jgi:isoleucyl-tRNA synthetase
MFEPVPGNPQFPQLEEEILEFWRRRRIYEQSLEQRREAPRFVFFEGPPTANGLPHPGHCLTRAIKDLFPRYRTMRGFFCERKGGWDTHGLPVEVEVCKDLGIHSKEEIEAYGVEPFIHKCQQSVWRYMKEWERLTERLGFWIHLDEAYVTYHQSYVESVWWSLKNLFQRGLLYQGYKIVWWWAQGGTALSSGEVGQGYREVADPSVFVRFPLLDRPGVSLLVWTTTPWTLPSNQFAAVHPDLTYVVAHDAEAGCRLIMAEALLETVAGKVKRELTVESRCLGQELIGLRYQPPFDYYYKSQGDQQGPLRSGGTQHLAWRVVAAGFVTIESGTGVVHEAPAFGEVDYELLLSEQMRFERDQGPQLLCAVAADGRFTSEAPDFAGRWVKEADKDIVRQLKQSGVLYHQEQYLHEYPFCWRAKDDPLIQYPRRSWFIRTTKFKERMLQNNRQINWLPDHIRDGRFGNFLETNVDWALSRERFWGTPLPIWVCETTGQMEALGSYAELLAKPDVRGTEAWEEARKQFPQLPEDLKVHKPYIDQISYQSPFDAAARMRRAPDVIDCWYDSGAMPFAQWGYPHTGRAQFARQFPADFISEALDQTRGWFYSLLAISTLLFGDEKNQTPETPAQPLPHPYRNCVVLGLMLGEDGEKMSKSKRNYREPQEIFKRYGADALRWYFFANQAPWTSIRYKEQAIKDSIPEFLLRLWNVYSFFVIYAGLDEFHPAKLLPGQVGQLRSADLARGAGYRPVSERAELDRWVLSELHTTVREVVERMDAYDNFAACRRLTDFVDALSNWYVRSSRGRFWSEDKQSPDKRDAYWTLYECLLTTSKLIAPFTPFLAETMWRNLAGTFQGAAVESVHLCDFPLPQDDLCNPLLSQQMQLLRTLASLGRNARMANKLKVRQPLAEVEVVLASDEHQAWLEAHDELLRNELNVKHINYTQKAHYIEYQVQPNFKRLGPRLGKLMPSLKQRLAKADGATLLAQLHNDGLIRLPVEGSHVELDRDDVQITIRAKQGWAAADDPQLGCAVVLNTELTPQLVREGLARDLVRLVNEQRKERACQYNDRIRLGIVSDDEALTTAIQENLSFVCQETLAVEVTFEPLANVSPVEVSVAEIPARLFLQVTTRLEPNS